MLGQYTNVGGVKKNTNSGFVANKYRTIEIGWISHWNNSIREMHLSIKYIYLYYVQYRSHSFAEHITIKLFSCTQINMDI